MSFKADRLRALRESKGFSQEKLAELAGVSQSVIPKAEKGKSVPSGDVLHKLSCALDCTMDYLYGRGDCYENVEMAASQMSFDAFVRQEGVTNEQRERCRRVLQHADAPKTLNAWQSLVEMMDLAIGPMNPSSATLTVVKHRPRNSHRSASGLAKHRQ
jgi:transcriptional regulator with XRE-family HTH domain